jgi:hypothetical protein
MSVHLRLPLTLAADGSFATVAEDSEAEVVQCTQVVLRSRAGERLTVPTLGIPDPAFTGLDVQVAIAEVERWEPRAQLTVDERLLGQDGVELVDLLLVTTRDGSA